MLLSDMTVFIVHKLPGEDLLSILKLWLLATLTISDCCGSAKSLRSTATAQFIRQKQDVRAASFMFNTRLTV